MNDMTDLELAIEAAKVGGEILLRYFGKEYEASYKENATIVTIADKESEAAIIAILKRSPHSIIAEESGEEERESALAWAIDPLDGTSNFSQGIPLFCVSIGLVKDNVPQLGVIYVPVTGELFTAERGKGAYLNGKRLDATAPGRYPIIGADRGRKKRPTPDFFAAVAEVTTRYTSIRSLGSAALALAYCAAGRMEGFFSWVNDAWDVSAGAVIAQEAGVLITEWDGKHWAVGSGSILAAKPYLHGDLVAILAKHD
jgi:myo-inositol-1(or 4)-monophosphatase